MEIFMAKYGEIALKGNNKRLFEERMIKNIKRRLSPLGGFTYERAQSTLYITPVSGASENANLNEAERRLLTVFGLGAVQRSLSLPKDYGEIVRLGVPYLENKLVSAKSFKVEAKRADKAFPMNSMELMREFGGAVLEAFPHLKVDLHSPDVTVHLEIRDNNAFVCPNRLQGAGGIPVGTSGKALVLLSGGIDSPVAAYMMAKRGLTVDMLHFQSPPYTSERALIKVESLCEKLSEYCGEIRLFCINLTEAQEDIRDNCPEEFMTVLLRRAMMKIAMKLCGERHYSAVITGESVGQVASQTPAAIICTDDAANLPVYRPVIGMDKIEITAIARKIGTFEISTLPYEDCCTVFTPRRPKLKPLLSDVQRLEKRLNPAFIQDCSENINIKIFGQL
ncbi:MAG: tRNA 4-thiouridine(8) synthase ThiI [Oscillospiraceae bacterium]|jgi:thiamine biosynthesis protein ThiI|nr:tRNA 4-thiouridine(8) synthase ThiI [Oscillospiraceae bacterium]